MNELCLELTDFVDKDHWRWVLTDTRGFMDDHQVALDPKDPEYEAFNDLYSYLQWHTIPDRRLESEAEIVDRVGRWIGAKLFGPLGDKIVASAPVTVRVRLASHADALLYRPLELGFSNGHPLAEQDVSLVFDIAEHRLDKVSIHDRLRMLAIFSLPTDASPLGLRRERYALKNLIKNIRLGIDQDRQKAIELRVLQYGATQDRLRESLEEEEGWDLIHFSGHGLPAGLLLEKPDGAKDTISVRDLERLLYRTRQRVKLIVLSACESAAVTLEETLSWLKLFEPSRLENRTIKEKNESEKAAEPLPSLAKAFVERLDCAVVAMRYPVGDDFAIDLSKHLYEGLLGKRRTLPAALQLAIAKAVPQRHHPGIPLLSVATPALFGSRAINLSLIPPDGPKTSFESLATGIPPTLEELEHFVGRTGPMSRASIAIAPKSGKTGILFHGMPGAGKTACANELTFRYETGRFESVVWYEAPKQGRDIAGALVQLALCMETQLPDFKMVHALDRADVFFAWLPRVTKLMNDHSVLIVLDNLESLVTSEGRWRDDRWGQLVKALLHHRGHSRTVLTSRNRLSDLGDEGRLQVEHISTLSLNETVHLARELPNLGRLLRGESPVELEKGRELATRALAVVQGHPQLIKFAEGQAADPEVLVNHLERAERKWAKGKSQLEAFFNEGQSRSHAEEFLGALNGWSGSISSVPPSSSRTLFNFLCAIEEEDRQDVILGANWSDFWRQLEGPGDTPEVVFAMTPLTASGLVEAHDLNGKQVKYGIHPAVAENARDKAGSGFQAAADKELASFWLQVHHRGWIDEKQGWTGLVADAGTRAAPYLMRLKDWKTASMILSDVLHRDNSPRRLAIILPIARQLAAGAHGTDKELIANWLLAKALFESGQLKDAEARFREIVSHALEAHKVGEAFGPTSSLFNLYINSGRIDDAFALIDEMENYIRQVGNVGAWTTFAVEKGWRLIVMSARAPSLEVLQYVEWLQEEMCELPEKAELAESVNPWDVREPVLSIGSEAADKLELWEKAQALNSDVIASKKDRGAPALDVAEAELHCYFGLIGLGRYDEARKLLENCKRTFEKEEYAAGITRVFRGQADLEDALGHRELAVRFSESALRYAYLTGHTRECAIAHYNHSTYLMKAGEDQNSVIAHRLASAIIEYQTESRSLNGTLNVLADYFSKMAPDEPPVPHSFDSMCEIVGTTEGVYFKDLVDRLPPTAPNGDEALRVVIRKAREFVRKAREFEPESQSPVSQALNDAGFQSITVGGGEFSIWDTCRAPSQLPSWTPGKRQPWIVAMENSTVYMQPGTYVELNIGPLTHNLDETQMKVQDQVHRQLVHDPTIRSKIIKFKLRLTWRNRLTLMLKLKLIRSITDLSEAASNDLGKLWSGLGALPYDDDDLSTAIANYIVIMLARLRQPMSMDKAASMCFGDAIEVEFGARAYGYSRGYVSQTILRSAVRSDVLDFIKPERRKWANESIEHLLMVVRAPSRLFEFEPFAKAFARQLVPTQVAMNRSTILFSPAGLETFGLP